jgi:DNA-binding CsgD family transcriptional regulator
MNSGSAKMMERTGDVDELKACLNDLIGILTLPALWTGREQDHVIRTLTDAVCRTLQLDFVYARLNLPNGEQIERVRIADSGNVIEDSDDLRRAIRRWLMNDPKSRSTALSSLHDDSEPTLAAFSLGLDESAGVFVAASDRSDFPTKSERLLLSVAAHQATIGLREAQLLSEKHRLAQELGLESTQRKEALAIAKDEQALRSLDARFSHAAQEANAAEESHKAQLAGLKENYDRLTRREREVLPFVIAGRLSKQIAAELGTSEITIRVHRGQIMRKMQAQSLADLIRMADRLGVR